jgi:sugar lactone lactonase YvrE
LAPVAGTAPAVSAGPGGPATEAALNRPTGIAFAADGTMYIGDSHNHRVRTIAP